MNAHSPLQLLLPLLVLGINLIFTSFLLSLIGTRRRDEIGEMAAAGVVALARGRHGTVVSLGAVARPN
jgi:hypothetical protein